MIIVAFDGQPNSHNPMIVLYLGYLTNHIVITDTNSSDTNIQTYKHANLETLCKQSSNCTSESGDQIAIK